MISTSLSKMRRGRGEHAARHLDDAHGVLTGDESPVAIALAAAEAGQDERGAAGDEVAAVELGGDVHGELAVAQGVGGVSRCPARPGGNFRRGRRRPWPRRDAWRGWRRRCRSRARAASGMPHSRSSAARKASGIFSKMPMVRSPWTLLWPRTGQSPAPGRPIAPSRRWTLTTSRMVATALRCWVRPMAQQVMSLRSPSSTVAARARISSSPTPLMRMISDHGVSPTRAAVGLEIRRCDRG